MKKSHALHKILGQDDPLCGECSRLSGGCCVTTPDDTAYCFPLSQAEIERLIPHARLSRAFSSRTDDNGVHEPKNDAEARQSITHALPNDTGTGQATRDVTHDAGAGHLIAHNTTHGTAQDLPNDTGTAQPIAHEVTHGMAHDAPNDARTAQAITHDTLNNTEAGRANTNDAENDPMRPSARQAVCSLEPNSSEFIKSMGYLFPTQDKKIKELFPADSAHYRLRLDEKGACIFLGEEGCRLPRGARPWYCLLFPVWFQSGELTAFISDVCLATRGITDPLQVLQRLDVSEHAAREIFNRLIADWGFTCE